jgi:type II secretory pathway component PulF
MARYIYKALNQDGTEVSGRHESGSKEAAFEELSERGLFPLTITSPTNQRSRLFSKGITRKLLTQTMRQLATLISAGVPLHEAIESLRRSDAHPELAERAARLSQHLRRGEPLSSGLREHFKELPDYVSSLVDLGTETGHLADTLRDAADRMAADDKLASDLRSALAYPAALGLIGFVIIFLMFLFVIPRFGTLIDRSGADIPAVSRMVIQTGVWMQANWVIVIAGLISSIVLLRWLVRRNRTLMRRIAMRLPGIGGVLRRADLAIWARTMGVALANGASLMTALNLAERATKGADFSAELAGVRRAVRSGEDLGDAFATNVSISDPLLIDLLQTGKKSGTMDKMLLLAAENYEDEMAAATKQLTSIAEPVAILMLSVVVGGLVISIVMAMTSLYQFDF